MNYRDMLLEEYLDDVADDVYSYNETKDPDAWDTDFDSDTIKKQKKDTKDLINDKFKTGFKARVKRLEDTHNERMGKVRGYKNAKLANDIFGGRVKVDDQGKINDADYNKIVEMAKAGSKKAQKALIRYQKGAIRHDIDFERGNLARRMIFGSKDLGDRYGNNIGNTKIHGMNIAHTALSGTAAAGGAVGIASGIKLAKLKKNGHEMYLAAKAAGKVKEGETEAQWIARQIKAAKIGAIAGGATSLASIGAKGVLAAVNSGKYKGDGAKDRLEKWSKESGVALKEMYDLEYDLYKQAYNEGLSMAYLEGYHDYGYEEEAILEALDYADELLDYVGVETDGAFDARDDILAY